jgi:Flp pilus assembly protein CpaB
MPISPDARGDGGQHTKGLLVGVAVVGLLFCFSLVLWFAKLTNAKIDVSRGWNLVPIIVASTDLSEDSIITTNELSQRMFPEQFVTSSFIRPDSASYIVKQRILVRAMAGDPLYWTDFQTNKNVGVLFALRDVAGGTVLSPSDVGARTVRKALTSPSWVPSDQIEAVANRKVLVAFRKGDPILFTQLVPKGQP